MTTVSWDLELGLDTNAYADADGRTFQVVLSVDDSDFVRIRIHRLADGWQVEDSPTVYPTLRTALHVALQSLVPALAAGLDGEETENG